MKKITIDSNATKIKANCNEKNSDTWPIKIGSNSIEKVANIIILAIPVPVSTLGKLPPTLNNKGTIMDKPIPISENPMNITRYD